MPPLTPPVLEFGDVFLRPGNIEPGFTLPTGAVWQPRFWLYGTLRSAVSSFDPGGAPARATHHRVEWFNRADIYGNLQLTGTERLLIGITPLNEGASFTGKVFKPDNNNSFQNHVNTQIRTFFFEGDIGQIFPGLDPSHQRNYDIGFSIGRQDLSFQGGMLLNDSLDALGVTRNNIRIDGWDWLSNLRVTGLAAWGGVNRNDSRLITANNNVDDVGARLYGLFTSMDTVFGNHGASTIDIDLTFVDGKASTSGSAWVWGIGATQRLGHLNDTLRILGSHATGTRTPQSNNGTLVFNELSWSPARTDSIAYVNAFWGNGHFTSAARGPFAGGPLGRVGILFAATGVGAYPAPLGSRPDNAAGGAIGYQMFFNENRRQLTFEIGGRNERTANVSDATAIGVRFQQAVGERVLLDVSAFRSNPSSGDRGYGLRFELQYKL